MVDAVICCFGGFFLFVKANSRKIKWFCCVGFLFSCNQPLCWWIFKVFVVSIGMVAVLLLFTWTNSMQDLRSPRRLISFPPHDNSSLLLPLLYTLLHSNRYFILSLSCVFKLVIDLLYSLAFSQVFIDLYYYFCMIMGWGFHPLSV